MGNSGVPALVQCAAYLAHEFGVETLSMGREGLDRKDSCTAEMYGRHLLYVIKLDGGFVFLSACPMDRGDVPEQLLSVGDGPRGWDTLTKLAARLERHRIKALQPRPLEIGPSGPLGFVIG
jgi:hypothetical protein